MTGTTPVGHELKYYFDISDTHEGRFHRPVPLVAGVRRAGAGDRWRRWSIGSVLWPMKETLEDAIVSAMENAVDG
ncbi:MAG: hypothetical protein ACLUS6_11930 [Dysosmobacter sp.]